MRVARYLTIECVAFRYVTQVFRNLHLLTYPTPLIYFFETSLANIFFERHFLTLVCIYICRWEESLLMALIRCPNCNSAVSSEAVRCPHCKVALRPQNDLCQCPECQNTIRFNQWTCPYCGYKRSKINFISKIIDGCFVGGLSLFLWISIAVICFIVIFNSLFGWHSVGLGNLSNWSKWKKSPLYKKN